MICEKCANWKCEKLTYSELTDQWSRSIDGEITPGYLKRYRKEAEREGVPFDDLKIGFKFCIAGVLKRFYLMKSDTDCKPSKSVSQCPLFVSETGGGIVLDRSPLWRICTYESHGITEVKGVTFTPGLYEGTYTRIPCDDDYRPEIENHSKPCAVCGESGKRTIVVRFEKVFCSNRHYLEWWAEKHPKEYRRLNK